MADDLKYFGFKRRQRGWRTAIHEAGHAVIAISERCPFEEVVLQHDGIGNGMLRNLSYRGGDDEVVRILLGGILAARLTRRYWNTLLFITSRDDLCKVAEFYADNPNPEPSLRYNLGRVLAFLMDSWTSVERIAEALLTTKQLSAAKIHAMYESGVKDVHRRAPIGKLGKTGYEPLYRHLRIRMRFADCFA
jgi:hypothetical protein